MINFRLAQTHWREDPGACYQVIGITLTLFVGSLISLELTKWSYHVPATSV